MFGETTTWHIWLQNTSVDYCWLLQYPVQCALSGHLLVSWCRSHSWCSHWLLPKHRVRGLRGGFGLVHRSPARERTQGREARSWAGHIPQPSNTWQMVAQGRADIQLIGKAPRGWGLPVDAAAPQTSMRVTPEGLLRPGGSWLGAGRRPLMRGREAQLRLSCAASPGGRKSLEELT